MEKKSQNFSLDIIIVVIIILFVGLTLIINQAEETETQVLDKRLEEQEKIYRMVIKNLEDRDILNSENEINKKLIKNLDEQAIKSFGVSHEICISFEIDEKLIEVGDNKLGIGSSDITINGTNCA